MPWYGRFVMALTGSQTKPEVRQTVLDLGPKVYDLVIKYGGTTTGEHNDGMSRGPWLYQMYSPEIIDHFKSLKNSFDPQNIFNPHKKTDANWDYSLEHIRQHF